MRKKISDIRRAELAEATFLTLQEYGVSGTTIQRVSQRAGMSHGLVHHYFKTKSDMLEAAVKLTNRRLTDEVLLLLKQAEGPRERLDAVIRGNFAPSIYTREVAQAWASCCGEAAFNPRFGRIMHMIERRLRSNLVSCLRPLLPTERVETVALGLGMLIDAAWLRCALSADGFGRERALAQIDDYIRNHLSAAEPARPVRRRAPSPKRG